MKTYLKRAFQLSDSGVKGLAKSIWSFFLYYVSFVPPMICVFLFADRLLNGNTGKPVVYLLFMLAATLVMYLVINYNYKTTYDETYQESANLRIDLAEQLSKLPLSYFSKHNLSDLAQTIMADVASIEHAFANAVANSIGFAIYFLVISVALYPAEKHDIKINKGDFVHETEKTFSFRTRTCDVPCYGCLRHEP